MTLPTPVRRGVRAATAVAALGLLLVGLPLGLAQLGGNPLPTRLPGPDGLIAALTRRDNGALFLRGLTVVGWLAWASFVLSVALEATGRLTRSRPLRLPWLGAQQRLAAALLGTVLAAGAAPSFIGSHTAAPASPPVVTPAGMPATGPAPGSAAMPVAAVAPAAGPTIHVVERGEALLDVQDRYGVPWQRIAEVNYRIVQPDGYRLEPGHERIYPGWQLRIPGAEQVSTPREELRYEVAEGDRLWHIAGRYLADPERYPEIAELNPGYAGRGSSDRRLVFPDYLEPGWTLRLPGSAVDGGTRPHARGSHHPDGSLPAEPAPGPPGFPALAPSPAPAPAPAAPLNPQSDLLPEASLGGPASAATGTATGPAATSPGASPTAPVGASQVGGAPTEPDPHQEPDPHLRAPAVFGGAGLLTALVVLAATRYRHRRSQDRGHGTMWTPASARLDRTLRVAQQPLDASRLDDALRGLAGALASRGGDLPDPAGVVLDGGTVELLLHRPGSTPPRPWQAGGDRWTLPAGESLPAVDPILAPLPALATVGSQAGRHVLLDLERLGVLTLHGDAGRATALARYVAAELARSTWSDLVDVLLAGFEPADADMIVSLNPGRVRVVASAAAGIRRLRRRMAATLAALQHSQAGEVLAGRVLGLAGDAWMPQVLLVAAPTEDDLAELARLQRELAAAGRCGVAVVTTGHAGRQPPAGWRVTLTAEGAIHLRLPFLHGCLSAATLSPEELSDLAQVLRHARTAPPVPVPPAVEPEAWAAGTDAAGALLPAPAPEPTADPSLDDDLIAWYAEDPGRPRIGVLGPVQVEAHGTPPESRLRLHRELIVYLAQRGRRGATAERLEAALWPDRGIGQTDRQLFVARARQWLGTDPGGTAWLSGADADLTYRLAEGYLFDWHLFRRLRTRAERLGDAGADDLRAALRLVRGVPLAGADRPAGPGTRNPFPWLGESQIDPDLLVAAVVDVAHQVAERCLADGDTDGVEWAVQQAWLADAGRDYDQPWRDLLRAEHAAGHDERVRSLLAELMEVRDAEAVDDLAPDTRQLIRSWEPSARPAWADGPLGRPGAADWSP